MAVLTQSSFTAGEVDPALWGRKDQGIYSSGLRRAANMVVHEGGGIYNREGFRFVGRVKDETRGARLFQFRFTSGDEYVIEAGHQYFRFWRDDAAVLAGDPKTITGVTKGATTTVTCAAHGFSAGDHVYIENVIGMPEINERMYAVGFVDPAAPTAGEFLLKDPSYDEDIDSSEWRGVYDATANAASIADNDVANPAADKPYELEFSTAKVAALLAAIGNNDDQIADRVADTSDTTFTESNVGGLLNVGPPYVWNDDVDEVEQIHFSQVGDIVTIVNVNHPVYELKRFGHNSWTMGPKAFPTSTHIRTNDEGDAEHISVNSGDIFGCDVSNLKNYLLNRNGVPGDANTAEQTGEYPSIIGFFQQRRVLGGRGASPDTVWYSAIGDYDDFISNPLVSGDTGFSATLATPTLTKILDIVSLREDIVFLTDDSVWGVRGSGGPGFSASTLFQAPQTRIGAERIRAVNFDDDIIFVRKGGRALTSVRYDANSGRYTPIDLSLSARQVFACGGAAAGIMETFYDRLRRVVVVNGEGQLAHLSVNLPYQLTAWTRWITRGEFTNSLATLGDEKLYAVIKRTVDGRSRHFIEVAHPHRRDRQVQDQFFVDAGLTYDGGAAFDDEVGGVFSYVPQNHDPNEICPEDVTIHVEGAPSDNGNGNGNGNGNRFVFGGHPLYVMRLTDSAVNNDVDPARLENPPVFDDNNGLYDLYRSWGFPALPPIGARSFLQALSNIATYAILFPQAVYDALEDAGEFDGINELSLFPRATPGRASNRRPGFTTDFVVTEADYNRAVANSSGLIVSSPTYGEALVLQTITGFIGVFPDIFVDRGFGSWHRTPL